MVADIETGKIGVVLCKDLSRLGRNNAMVAYYTELFFPDNNVRLIAPFQPFQNLELNFEHKPKNALAKDEGHHRQ
jgi:DNA invertase Pin-like site-specific DNA recombinase